jgi:hypothetical protein
MILDNKLRAVLIGSVMTLLTPNTAFAGIEVQPTPPPEVKPPTPIPEVKPPSPTPLPEVTAEAFEMEFAITPFSNMEHGWHVFEPGYRAVCSDGQGVVATAKLSIDAAVNGETTDGRGAYQGLIIRPVAQYIRRGATSGNCELSICLDQNAEQAQSQASCKQVSSVTDGDAERALSFKQSVPYRVQGNKISLQTGAPGLSAWHPAFGFAAPAKSFKDYQSPLVLDMNGDGVLSLTDVWNEKKIVQFDMALEGRNYPTGWVGPKDAFLVIDRNRNGVIDNSSELFGEYTGAEINGPKAFKNGFAALAPFDSNSDGRVDARDKQFESLAVWFDKNQNGKTDRGELQSLAEAGVKSIGLQFSDLRDAKGNVPLIAGNEVRLAGTFETTSGKTQKIADVWFKVRRNYNTATAMTKWLMAPAKQK